MSTAPSPTAHPDAPSSTRPGFPDGDATGTALVVDDERFFLTILGDFIAQHLGMRSVLVQDGTAALALLETETVDLVLLDILMPGMDGLETLRRMKDRDPTLPVIMVTATSTIDHVIAALREGADDFVRKPVDLDELALCVQRALKKRRLASLPPPPPRDAASDRRRGTRARPRTYTPAQLQLRDVHVIDISQSGALVEHLEPVQPGEIYRLALAVEGQNVPVLARATRVYASHRMTVARGERHAVYRTGMEFVGLKKDAAEAIEHYVESLLQEQPA